MPIKFSFSKSLRLKTKAEYKSVFDNSYKIDQKHLMALIRPNQKEYPRLGLIVGKRAARTAVARNRIKRLIRNNFRLNQKNLPGLDIVVIARKLSEKLNNAALHERLEKLWEKLLKK